MSVAFTFSEFKIPYSNFKYFSKSLSSFSEYIYIYIFIFIYIYIPLNKNITSRKLLHGHNVFIDFIDFILFYRFYLLYLILLTLLVSLICLISLNLFDFSDSVNFIWLYWFYLILLTSWIMMKMSQTGNTIIQYIPLIIRTRQINFTSIISSNFL